MKDNYIVAIDQINKLLNEIEVTTERTKNIENFDNLMKFEVAQEKEREIKKKSAAYFLSQLQFKK